MWRYTWQRRLHSPVSLPSRPKMLLLNFCRSPRLQSGVYHFSCMIIQECNPNATQIYAGPGSIYLLRSQVEPRSSVSLLLTLRKQRHLPEWQTPMQRVGVEIHRNSCRKRLIALSCVGGINTVETSLGVRQICLFSTEKVVNQVNVFYLPITFLLLLQRYSQHPG